MAAQTAPLLALRAHAAIARAAAATAVLSLAGAVLAQTATITELQRLPGSRPWPVEPSALSADGGVVVGWSPTDDFYLQAVRWTADGSVQAMPDDFGQSLAFAVSHDGRSVFGMITTFTAHQRAARWVDDGPYEDLGEGLVPGSYAAFDTSADGRVAVGDGGAGTNAWRWREGVGLEFLQDPGWEFVTASAVSADGQIVVGGGRFETEPAYQPYRWSAATGAEGLGVPEGWSLAYVRSASNSASVVLGDFHDDTTPFRDRALWRWTETGGYDKLHPPAGLYSPFLFQLSGDGAIAVGQASGDAAPFERAIFWTEATGMVELQAYLVGIGLDLSGWHLRSARAISNDGTAIAGVGIRDGRSAPFLVRGLRLPGSCRVDLDGDSVATVFDFLAFQNLFDAGDDRADFDADGELTIFDFLAFQTAFDAGCV